MMICRVVLDKLKVIPESAMYRIYTEEKMKYIMEITEETEDIQELEEKLGIKSSPLLQTGAGFGGSE